MKNLKLPELLSPAGSPEAFQAAIEGGADAIYVGGASFNARINAKNFSEEDIRAAVKLAHLYGVKVYQTVNIMVHGRELNELLTSAERSAEAGVDAFIVSDLGAAELLHKHLPDMPLHASTQMSIHSSAGAALLADRGFTRVVPARELSKEDISYLVEHNPLEVEIFIHGAMCVSHSGQCLFSSLVGGRSGNRGLCAQPCRLPYAAAEGRVGDKYPLSLKDMSLAGHVREIIDSGVASLKIEGRMKSPEYVRGVTSIWRRLLDERRDATFDEMRELAELFSRGGFSDGYYTGAIGRKMLGVRSEENKQTSREVDKFTKLSRKIPIEMQATLEASANSRLTLRCHDIEVAVEGDVPQKAINAPIDVDTVKRCMSKLGDSCFSLASIHVDLEDGLMMPISQLNALRRAGILALEEALVDVKTQRVEKTDIPRPLAVPHKRKVGRFQKPEQVTRAASAYFDLIFLPLDKYLEGGDRADGFVMPPVIFDSEVSAVERLLQEAGDAKYVIVSGLGQIALVKKHLPDAKIIADFRFNVGNDATICFFEDLGFDSVVVSTELTQPQIRDLKGAKAVVAYGRIPLMTLEKCVIKELYGDKQGCETCSRDGAEMKDRRGFVFPVIRTLPHRNIVLNSLPTQVSDRQDELDRVGATDRHFLFTVETPQEVDRVIEDYRCGRAPTDKVRRI